MSAVDPSLWTGRHSCFILFIYLFFLSPLFGPPFVVETFFVGEGGYNTFLFFIFLVVGYREWGSPSAVWGAERERESCEGGFFFSIQGAAEGAGWRRRGLFEGGGFWFFWGALERKQKRNQQKRSREEEGGMAGLWSRLRRKKSLLWRKTTQVSSL